MFITRTIGALVSLALLAWRLQPLCQLVAVGENSAASSSGDTVNGKSTLYFPTLDGAFSPREKGRNFLPRIQALARARVGTCHKYKGTTFFGPKWP